ncbi:MAG TPA: cytidylate kinase [Treponema sp.]|nr:cytidylate kinase [Treponema sp.]
MSTNIITVSRQFGSGGRIVAQAVAEKLGWKYYDRELIEKIAEKSGLAKEFVEERSESATSGQNLVYSMPAGLGGFSAGQSVFDKLYVMQYNIIKELADKEPCVFVGRCSDYVLRERKDCFNVFVYADMDFRIRRAEEVYKVEAKDTRKFLEDRDKKRRLYYKYNTDRTWGDVANYDLCLKSSSIGIDTCVQIILELITGARR